MEPRATQWHLEKTTTHRRDDLSTDEAPPPAPVQTLLGPQHPFVLLPGGLPGLLAGQHSRALAHLALAMAVYFCGSGPHSTKAHQRGCLGSEKMLPSAVAFSPLLDTPGQPSITDNW
ncbi:hypothetical protein P7K49_028455 [Saguinus oedipus]|uniref:Uncharacterized protein n=1 Tax=Saguinus oedipus TaxID=9490 RepID=A0ABQ9UEI4_SAGOE|nr:hypothetical protein P7K49_028455 [Saguinus oedipus]